MNTETVTKQIMAAEKAIRETSNMTEGSLESMEMLLGSIALSLVATATCLQEIIVHLEDIAIELDR
jgi:hypothetical protein